MGDLIRRRLGLFLVAIVIVVLASGRRVATFLTDLWWFDELGYRQVYTTVLANEIGLGVAFGAILAAVIAVNLVIARRLRPMVLPANQREAVIERYRQLADPYVPWIIAAISVLFGFSAGGAVANQWPRFLLWRFGGSFGTSDPQFGRDIGFYVFDLPWYDFLQGWLFTSLLLALIITAGAHYLLGGIRPQSPGEKVTPQARGHLSVLLGLVLAARGWGYWLDRFQLNFSPRGQVTGASYTDVNAELPALNLLLLATVVAIVLVLYNIRRRGWVLPGAAIGLLILASIILQGIYPAAIQRLRVDPEELAREEPFIERNLQATRRAYGLDEVQTTEFTPENDFAEQDLEEHEVTLENIRLWDPGILETTYQQLQALRPYYQFDDVDVDRYAIDGEPRQVMISSRELGLGGLGEQAQTWQNRHLTFTHGFGVVSSRVNTANTEGQPVFLSQDIPPTGSDTLIPDEPGIYYGETHRTYSLVGTDAGQIDYETAAGERREATYTGAGGVSTGNLWRRAAFATRFSDPNLVLTGLIRDESKIIFRRTVADRVRQVAPFLSLDDDPYPVVLDNRVKWVVDGFTTSAHYPYSERRTFETSGETVNYVRNAVKAVVDAYDGTVTLYVITPDDPVIQTWRDIFPDLFAPVEEAPEGLAEHFRYPEDLYTLQSELYRTYHIPTASAFYSKADEWAIPRSPVGAGADPGSQPTQGLTAGGGGGQALEPYYLLMRLPGAETTQEEFVLIRPYLPQDKQNMIAWIAGRSDPEHYGELFAVEFPSGQTVLGPNQVQARIEQDPQISEYITLRDQAGSNVQRGNLIIVPIERSVLYVEPLFVKAPDADIPELAQVVVVLGDDVVMEDTLSEALRVLTGVEEPEAPDITGGEPAGQGPQGGAPDAGPTASPSPDTGQDGDASVDTLVQRALDAFASAEQALQNGNLATYEQRVREAERLLEQVARLRGVRPGAGASPGGGAGTTGPTATPTPAGAGG